MKKTVISLFLLFVFITLYSLYMPKKELTKSFYHWENSFKIENSNEKLYIKLLDISFPTKLEVISTTFIQKAPKKFIPVVYITNEAMKLSSKKQLEETIFNRLKPFAKNFEEVQFDCDWSLSTRSKYFEFLKDIKKRINKKISATIRLHQIKYFKKTGVPPIDYGVLMYYNMSDIADFNTTNSILDNKVAKKYHYNFDIYPLRLKLALPLYSQAIQFRQKRPIDIFEGVEKKDLEINFKKLDKNFYEVKKSFYFKGRYVYKGDVFRFEDSNYEDLKIALDDFFKKAMKPYKEVIFYTIKYKNKYDLDKFLKGE